VTGSGPALAEEWLRPLVRARTALFVRALRSPPLRAVLVEKQRRVPALLLVHAVVAFALSVLAPTFLLVMGPLVLGVPHLVADVRFLVLRPALPRIVRGWLLGGALLLIGVRLAELAGFIVSLRSELLLATLWMGGGAVLGGGRVRDRRSAALGVLLTLFAAAAWRWPGALRLGLAHGHNVVALGVWALAFCTARRRALGVVAVVGLATLVLVASPLGWLGFRHGVQHSFGLHVFAVTEQLAPFARSAPLALGVVSSFAFLQSMHYAVWLHAIPQEAARGEGTLSFRMSFRALRDELGAGGLALAALLVLLVPMCGFFAPLRTQSLYLSLATFHGYLELGVLARWWLDPRSRP
jgi:hypothetical protein